MKRNCEMNIMKNVLLGGVFSFLFLQFSFAETVIVSGEISEIAQNKTEVRVKTNEGEVVVLTDEEFVDMAYFEVGDIVAIDADKSADNKYTAISFRYIFDELEDDNVQENVGDIGVPNQGNENFDEDKNESEVVEMPGVSETQAEVFLDQEVAQE